MDTKEIVKIDLEVFNNLSRMLNSSNTEDVEMALETIKNLNPDISKLESDNIENIKLIYESLVVEHFHALTEEYNFIDGKFKVKW